MADYDYECYWCMNKVVLNVDHRIYLICPICEKRTLKRAYPEANEEITEAFRRVMKNRFDQK